MGRDEILLLRDLSAVAFRRPTFPFESFDEAKRFDGGGRERPLATYRWPGVAAMNAFARGVGRRHRNATAGSRSAFDPSGARDRMIQEQIVDRGVSDPGVVEAMRRVPREAFIEPSFEEFAYEDGPLAIGEGQTISQPYVTALMIEAAAITSRDVVLEVGTGSGYAAAIVSRIAQRVYAIERFPSLVTSAQRRFDRLGYDNVDLRAGDGTRGWPEAAPFNAIVVSAGAPAVPQTLKQQLLVGGRLIIPVGEQGRPQALLGITRTSPTDYEERCLGVVMFVPLVGAQ